jgi:hypothetical protein
MLVPAAVLVLLILGAICVDSAVVFFAERDLANRTAAVASDVASATVDDASFYGSAAGAPLVLDESKAEAYARLAFAPDRTPAGYDRWSGEATTDGRTVTVVATAQVRYVFAKAIPGAPDTATVEARSVATAHGG